MGLGKELIHYGLYRRTMTISNNIEDVTHFKKYYCQNTLLNSITNKNRNTTKTTIQSTLEYEIEINEARVKNLRKVGYMGLQPQSMLKNPN